MLVADHASPSSGMRGNHHAAVRVAARLPAAQLSLRFVRRTFARATTTVAASSRVPFRVTLIGVSLESGWTSRNQSARMEAFGGQRRSTFEWTVRPF
jgi:hypothetical protein